ncbi:2-methylcitrate dehydratase [Caulobacter sp. D4A]|uniref:MmgE/PrpD family protein n=1 Tax=unclassified Caulobacter TaxID=2648921 RepID=UPI000D73B63C|nr:MULTISPECIES: MmgE/PrpD family protein [unclassified Caulobacter]PXA85415.1 2-methylcitrate dehydratase [Caulobacter sp. D4A]PXA92146.1 2-methylcitrate dehydratase [Caulobacter sp. D5]
MIAAEALVDHALSLRWDALPDAVQADARRLLHDAVAVCAAGAGAAYSNAILAAAGGWGGEGDGLVLGRPGVRLPPAQAAFVNAFQLHGQEYDSVHEKAVLHPLPTIAPALIAELDRSGPYSGEEVLAAMVAGVDVAIALGVAATTALRFFRPATAGVFGATAALARLKRLPRETAMDAMGYALAFSSGTMQAHTEGKPALPVQIAAAARSALQAIDVAEAGLPGPRDWLEGPFGYLPLFEAGFDLAPVLADLPSRRRIAEVSCKPFPTGRACHGGLVAVRKLATEHGVGPEDLESLTYSAPPLIRHLVGRVAKPEMDTAYARLCLPYLAAVMLTRGRVGLDDYTPQRLNEPDVLALAARIVVTSDGNPDPAAFVPARAIAKLKDGREIVLDVAAQLGSPDFPMSRDEHLEKARSCLAFVGMEAIHAPLTDLFDRFDTLADAREVFLLASGG